MVSGRHADLDLGGAGTALPAGGVCYCEFHADVLVLQEVRDEECIQRLANLLAGFQVHVVSQFKDDFTHTRGIQQIAILSRYHADGARAESWKRGWANAPPGYAFARLMISGKPLHVYGLHLKSNLGDPVANISKREDAMRQLLDHIGSRVKDTESVVVSGDFNTSKDQVNLSGDTTLNQLEEKAFVWTFAGIPSEHRITVPAKGRYPATCFDHIYVRGLGRPAAMVLSQTRGLDHLPVVVDLTVGLPGPVTNTVKE